MILRLSATPGSEQTHPGSPPLAELAIGARFFAGPSQSACVGRAWRRREAAGGYVDVRSRSCFMGVL